MPAFGLDDLTQSAYSFPGAPMPTPVPAPTGSATLRGDSEHGTSTPGDNRPGDCEGGDRWDPVRRECVAGSGTQCPTGWHWSDADRGCVQDGTDPFAGLADACKAAGKEWDDNLKACLDQGYHNPGTGGGHNTPAPYTGPAAPKSSGGPSFSYSPMATDFNALLDKMIREGLAAPSRYTPEALQALYGQITRQASNRIQRGTAAVRADAARRNMSRAGSIGAGVRAVREGAETERGTSMVQVQMAKINADFADKNAALDRAQRYLDSLRDSEYRMMIASEQRRQYDANLALSYANLAQQRTMLEMTLQSDWDKLRAMMGFSLLSGGI